MDDEGNWVTTQASAVLVDQQTAIQRGTRDNDIVQILENHSGMISLTDINTEMNVVKAILQEHLTKLAEGKNQLQSSAYTSVSPHPTSYMGRLSKFLRRVFFFAKDEPTNGMSNLRTCTLHALTNLMASWPELTCPKMDGKAQTHRFTRYLTMEKSKKCFCQVWILKKHSLGCVTLVKLSIKFSPGFGPAPYHLMSGLKMTNHYSGSTGSQDLVSLRS